MGLDTKTLTQDEIPYLSWLNHSDRPRALYKSAREQIRSMGDKLNSPDVYFGDLSSVLSPIKETAYVDTVHLNSRGNKIVARGIVDQLVSHGLLRSAPP